MKGILLMLVLGIVFCMALFASYYVLLFVFGFLLSIITMNFNNIATILSVKLADIDTSTAIWIGAVRGIAMLFACIFSSVFIYIFYDTITDFIMRKRG